MFNIENKTRQIVAEMLLSMNERLVICMRDTREIKHTMDLNNQSMEDIKKKLDREAKIKDLVAEIKFKVNTMVSFAQALTSTHCRTKRWPRTSKRHARARP